MSEREQDQPRHPETGEPVETVKPSPAEREARNKRNIAIGIALVGFAVLIFAVTVMRLSSNIAGG